MPLNEGWGQHETAHKTRLLRSLDPSRLVNSTSGWEDRGGGDFYDLHDYTEIPASPDPRADRCSAVGEFGGLGLAVPGHLWSGESWGYQSYEDAEALFEAYRARLGAIHRGIVEKRLQAAVYTQTTDVEIEVNGLLTYDRAVTKIPAEKLKSLHAALIAAGSSRDPRASFADAQERGATR